MPDAVAQFTDAKYLSLESFRKTGVGVRTPVWFAQDPGSPMRGTLARVGMDEPDAPVPSVAEEDVVFYVYSAPDSGKVKRIRNNPKVRVTPCDFRGNIRGAWIDARASICQAEEAARGQELLRKKYGWLKITGDFFARLRRRPQAVIAIHLG